MNQSPNARRTAACGIVSSDPHQISQTCRSHERPGTLGRQESNARPSPRYQKPSETIRNHAQPEKESRYENQEHCDASDRCRIDRCLRQHRSRSGGQIQADSARRTRVLPSSRDTTPGRMLRSARPPAASRRFWRIQSRFEPSKMASRPTASRSRKASKIVKIEWIKTKNSISPYFVEIPDTLKRRPRLSRRTPRDSRNTHGWAYAQFALRYRSQDAETFRDRIRVRICLSHESGVERLRLHGISAQVTATGSFAKVSIRGR